MKKLVAFLMFFSLLASCLCVNSFAVDNVVYNFVPLNENTVSDYSTKIIDNDFTVVTKLASGEITSKVRDRANYNRSELICSENLNTEPYLPEISSCKQSVTLANTSTDSYGRYQVSDTRVGIVNAGFDTDDDGDVDEVASASGSLQHYDIIVSCAHVLWSPIYADFSSEGWASELDFYAGVNGGNLTPVAESSYISISISQAYVNGSSFTINPDGSYNTSKPLNHDWSIIQLADNIGSRCGWYGLHGCGTPETGVSIYTIGYPDNQNFTQWRSNGTISSFSDNIVFHTAYISPGYSGSPILNNSLLYGVATGKMSGQFTGVRMFDELFGMIVDSRNESEARWG